MRTPRGTIEHVLGRTMAAKTDPVRHEVVRYETNDTRPAPRRDVVIPLSPASSVSWELVYQRVTGAAQAPPFEAVIEAETPLASGTLAPVSSPVRAAP
jgi:hypothetical protein